jgi:hypothetical protein
MRRSIIVVVAVVALGIAAIHWTRVPSADNNEVLAGPFPGAQSFVVGSPLNVPYLGKAIRQNWTTFKTVTSA